MAKRKQDIRTFFVNKKKKKDENANYSETLTVTVDKIVPKPPSPLVTTSLPPPSVPLITSQQHEEDECDYGKFIAQPPQTDLEKIKVFKEPWFPPETFKFPVTEKRNLSFQRHWLQKYPWLVYTAIAPQGALCKMCVLFGKTEAGRGDQELGCFVKKPYNNWKKALESFNTHENTKYHRFAIEQAKNFTMTMEGKANDVIEAINKKNDIVALENRKRLVAIVETILLCGRQEMPLRGDDESGAVGLDEPTHNDGNFRALLRYRARSGDGALKNHLLTQNNHCRSMYTSAQIQNEIIELCGNDIRQHIINRINDKEDGYFTVLADETQDISRQEQLALCLRYADFSSGKTVIREDFLDFVHVEDVTAQGLATTIISKLLSYKLNMDNLIGQGFDGAAVMSGRLKGVRTLIAEQYPKAQFVHCAAHVLNLVLVHSCEIPMIRNCLGTIKSVINFFRLSPLRDHLLKKAAEEIGASHSTLISLCETRWIEKHTAVERFAEMFPVVLDTLDVIQNANSGNREVTTQACQLKLAVENSQFIISLVILRKVFSYTTNLSKALQRVNVDLVDSCNHANTVKETLQKNRDEGKFAALFEEAKILSPSGEIVAPRTTARQTHRNNVPGETAEIYYRRNVYYPFLEHLITELDARFKPHENTVGVLQKILPTKTNIDNATETELTKVATTFLGKIEEKKFKSEYELWHNHWSSLEPEKKPTTAIGAIDQCDPNFFTLTRKLLLILATLPVSTATAERSFSTLKRLKTYLRNRTGQERFTGLALMSIHREVASLIDADEIVNELVLRRKRLNIII